MANYLRFLFQPHGDADLRDRHINQVASILLGTASLTALLIAAAVYVLQ